MILEHEEKLLEKIDASVATASDDDLFAGGYLRGHISLAAAYCETAGIDDIDVFNTQVSVSLDNAKTELSPADRIIVSALWGELSRKI